MYVPRRDQIAKGIENKLDIENVKFRTESSQQKVEGAWKIYGTPIVSQLQEVN